MFSDLLMHRSTARQLENYLARPAHGLLISGPAGSGKITVARALAARLLEINTDALDNYAHFIVVRRPEGKQEIIIESIRDLTKALSLKIPGDAAIKRVIIIEDAHFMNQAAQNALLKSLEEPSPATVFILTATDKADLLTTIASRSIHIPINPVSRQAAAKFLKDVSAEDVNSAWALSQGSPGLLISLARDEDSSLRSGVDQAKKFLSLSRYERLLAMDQISKNKEELSNLLEGLKKVLGALYRSSAQKNDNQKLNKFVKATKMIAESQKDLDSSVNARLIILKLAVNLPV